MSVCTVRPAPCHEIACWCEAEENQHETNKHIHTQMYTPSRTRLSILADLPSVVKTLVEMRKKRHNSNMKQSHTYLAGQVCRYWWDDATNGDNHPRILGRRDPTWKKQTNTYKPGRTSLLILVIPDTMQLMGTTIPGFKGGDPTWNKQTNTQILYTPSRTGLSILSDLPPVVKSLV